MDELFVLVYFLILLNMFIILFMGYKECNNLNTKIKEEFPLTNSLEEERGIEADNIFIRNR